MSTALEDRLAIKAAQVRQKNLNLQEFSNCRHEILRFLGEIESTRLSECEKCGMVLGVAK